MLKKIFAIFLISFSSLQAQAFEEYIVVTDGKLSNITVKDSKILKITPLVTIDNSKNTLFITPLKTGETSFSVRKNNEIFDFKVKITKNKTFVSSNNGFAMESFDQPPIILDRYLDKPPIIKDFSREPEINIDGTAVNINNLKTREGK